MSLFPGGISKGKSYTFHHLEKGPSTQHVDYVNKATEYQQNSHIWGSGLSRVGIAAMNETNERAAPPDNFRFVK